jgi:hypothetical protein
MYGVMRKYKINGSFEEINAKVRDGLVPLIKGIKGFRAYRTVNLGGGFVASFSLFDNKAAADAASKKAREWIAGDPSMKKLAPNPPGGRRNWPKHHCVDPITDLDRVWH